MNDMCAPANRFFRILHDSIQLYGLLTITILLSVFLPCTKAKALALFSVSDNGLCRVVCREPEKVKHSVTVQNGTLIISAADSREWHDRIGINLQSPEVTVYLPKAGYETLSITGSTGSIEIPNEVKYNRANFSISTGNADYYASGSDSITISTSTGDIHIELLTK